MRMRLPLQLIVLLVVTVPAVAESNVVEIRAMGEHRIAAGETPEAAKQMALVEAGRNVLRDAITHLQGAPEVKALSLKTGQIEALLPVIMEWIVVSASADAAADGVFRVQGVVG